MSARRQEQEQVRREATEDLTDDLSEGEKGDTLSELAPVETSKKTSLTSPFGLMRTRRRSFTLCSSGQILITLLHIASFSHSILH
jgi:hypothetical protein